MTREQAAAEVKARYAEYLQPAKVKGTYVCPIPECKNGTGSDGDGIRIDPSAKNPYTLHCFKCGFHGDIIDLYQKEHNCDAGAAFAALYNRFGIIIDNDRVESPQRPQNDPQRVKIPPTPEKPAEGLTEATADYRTYYRACIGRMNDPAAREYLSFRGISEETAARYWLGYDPAADPASAPGAMGNEYKPHPCPRLIIPFDRGHYMGRSIDPATEKRYQKINSRKQSDDDAAPPFNLKALYNAANRPVFITEGAIDALSIIEAGGVAMATNSASNRQRIIEALKEKRTSSTIILCYDTDDTGKRATRELAEGLRGLNISHITADICAGHKDPNDALRANREAFIEAVRAAERRTSKPDNTADYISQFMAGEIEKLRKDAARKTGFPNLDKECGGVYPGLYAVGGISAVGKTTFIHQMADQMAAAGQHVLFFSMEQSRLEMASKSISRTTAQKDVNTAVSSIAIRTGSLKPVVLDAADEYSATVGDRLSVIEGNFNCTVSFIGEYTRRYIEKNGVNPVIIVDYLQVLRAEKDPETGRKPTDTKQIVDYNVTQLKRMSRSLDIPIFVISSLNRSNYLTPVDFEAFKESGGIEYTADVVWGLQLKVMNDEIFDKEGKIKEKRQKVKEAKAAIPREIELVCLKNRYGRNYEVYFTYYPQFDLFKAKAATYTPSASAATRKW